MKYSNFVVVVVFNLSIVDFTIAVGFDGSQKVLL